MFLIFIFLITALWLLIVNIRVSIKPVSHAEVPVICFGNLSMGGTGKTPTIISFITDLKENPKTKDLKIGLLTRGYKSKSEYKNKLISPSENKVASKNFSEISKVYGDEPALIHSIHPDIHIAVGKNRIKSIELLKNKVDLILMDDGLQYKKLRKDIKVFLFDSTKPFWTYNPLPLGLLREPLRSISKDDFCLINKGSNKKLYSSLQKRCNNVFCSKIYYKKVQEPLDKKVILLSGIANPKHFESEFKNEHPSLKVIKHIILKDHKKVSTTLLNKLNQQQHKVITTEKDEIKIKNMLKNYESFKLKYDIKALSISIINKISEKQK